MVDQSLSAPPDEQTEYLVFAASKTIPHTWFLLIASSLVACMLEKSSRASLFRRQCGIMAKMLGIATAARMPMMAQTMKISVNVKPLEFQ
jgi:hypothetical protein